MSGSRFTLTSRMVVLCIVVLFLWAYLFQSLLVGLMGAAVLFYLAYRRMEFHSLSERLDLKLERKIMETVVHKGSPLTVGLEISSDEPAKLEGKDRLPDHFQL
ncbi:MAG: hypothetical protein U9R75_03855, partial [Candidatus Thermoplasmatota archaeon]|nr:hypothetical protein [Candidatus Thermoplasmatota archaeon]